LRKVSVFTSNGVASKVVASAAVQAKSLALGSGPMTQLPRRRDAVAVMESGGTGGWQEF
jgi:hypothetical protein